MVVKLLGVPIVLAALLTACDWSPRSGEKDNATNATSGSNANEVSVPKVPEPRPTHAESLERKKSRFTPPELTPQAERGEKGARNLLLTFARAIESKQFVEAWELLSPADQQKWTKSDFAAIFSDLGKTSVAIAEGMTEGAAGSLYYTAPITITGSDKDGRPVRIEGKAVLRRVNDVDGTTPPQLRWHFDTLSLSWTH